MYKFGFLGLGKMGSAILNGILSNGIYKTNEIAFYAPSLLTQEKYSNIGLNLVKDERELFEKCEIILLAIKPQIYDGVLNKIKDLNYNCKTIISLAPGKSIKYLASFFEGARIVRAMPNTPALINKAVTTLAFSDNSKTSDIEKIFASIGIYLVVEEEKIDEAVPLNGSMTAYILEFAKAFIDKGMEYGFSYADGFNLVMNSIIGSCQLAINSNNDLGTLINNVCSKGGSTIAGLNELKCNGFDDAISKCYDACVKRSKELGNV